MNTLRLILVACFLGLSLDVHAGVVSRDLEASGDGLLTFDTHNNREWLDLPETAELGLADVLTQMLAGGRLEGFRFATLTEVSELAESAEVGWTAGPWLRLPGMPEEDVDDLVNLLGPVLTMSGGLLPEVNISFGLIAHDLTPEGPRFDDTNFYVLSMYGREPLLPGTINSPLYHVQVPYGGVFTDGPVSFPTFPDLPPLGIGDIGPFWLYRVVPEPSSAVLLFLGFGVGLLKRDKSRR
jgi:hypothetical protein